MTIRETPISRRAVLGGVTFGGAALVAAGPALASLPHAAAPHPRLLERARDAFVRYGSRISARDVVAIADYSLHSAFPRFFLYAPESGHATALRVSHGRGSDPAHSGYLQRFSAQPGSAASSAGAYLTGASYVGQHGNSRRLIGLEPENSTAEARAIVIHGAWYCEPQVLKQTGKLGRSEGCFAFSQSDVELVLARLGPGHLLFSGRA
ncbi:murein L,D-transpeptidase catalytic domain-containing protein [Sandarakinorhabdus sp.]|uniref:murein L,D-transpeptidase catalytic domain-containing protein n=1 Tax=Sandarakinorhabdus sp. TaxID=1916663 RepID=UPI00286DF1F5|nr:murein L,D-transpeptidase catalytic domain family protein [Sandarakinorhabdus sp.]